jgi:hypothetical protein
VPRGRRLRGRGAGAGGADGGAGGAGGDALEPDRDSVDFQTYERAMRLAMRDLPVSASASGLRADSAAASLGAGLGAIVGQALGRRDAIVPAGSLITLRVREDVHASGGLARAAP